MFSIETEHLIMVHHGRTIVLDTADYQRRVAACLVAGFRLVVARIVADRVLTSEDARALAIEIGLVKRG